MGLCLYITVHFWTKIIKLRWRYEASTILFDSDFNLQQIQILHLDVKVKNVQIQKLENFEKRLLLF